MVYDNYQSRFDKCKKDTANFIKNYYELLWCIKCRRLKVIIPTILKLIFYSLKELIIVNSVKDAY